MNDRGAGDGGDSAAATLPRERPSSAFASYSGPGAPTLHVSPLERAVPSRGLGTLVWLGEKYLSVLQFCLNLGGAGQCLRPPGRQATTSEGGNGQIRLGSAAFSPPAQNIL